jgi:hypothetical protein
MCQCNETGIIYGTLGTGLYSFAPCFDCGVHIENKRQSDIELRQMIAECNSVKENMELIL